MTRFASFEDMALPGLPGSAKWSGIRSHFGIESFGVNAWTSTEVGQDVIGEHDELGGGASGHEELYVVMTGRATFTVDGEEFDAPAGTVVLVRDPAAKRRAVATEATTTILVFGAKPGEAFVASEWELSTPAFAYFGTGEYEKAYELLAKTHEERPEVAGVLYNLACAESRTGRTEDAIAHLRKALELGERYREPAKTDPDFDPIRGEAAFRELVG